MLNPVHRSATQDSAARYRVEPYVLAADIYSGPGISQRGGWTWYTGAAGWLYRAVVEYVLGVRVSGDSLQLSPCMPPEWEGFELRLTLPEIDYTVAVSRSAVESPRLSVDGAPVAGDTISLLRDQRSHRVELLLPQAPL
jgi:cellobiose phosphorylase